MGTSTSGCPDGGGRRAGASRFRPLLAALLALACGFGLLVAVSGPASATITGRSTGYNAVTPARVLDTRSGVGARKGVVAAASTITLKLTGVAGIPTSDVGAVVLNLRAMSATAKSFLTVYPTGSTRPVVPNVSFPAGVTTTNLVLTQVSATGFVTIYNSAGKTQVVADVSGWYDTGSYYTPLTPARILDTRSGLGATKATVGAAKTVNLTVAGAGKVPASGVAAVAVDVTGVSPTAATAISVYPTGTTRPKGASLYVAKAGTGTALAVVKLGTEGKITLYNSAGKTNLLADVVGWYAAGGQFTPITSTRILDTRTTKTPLKAATTRLVPVSGCCAAGHGDSYAALVSITALAPTAKGYLSVGGSPTSTLDFTAGRTVANLAVAQLNRSGEISVYNSAGTTGVTVDLLGVVASPLTVGALSTSEVGTVGAPIIRPFFATVDDSLTWSVSAGALPDGTSFTPVNGGTLTGTPTTAGTYSATIKVTDRYGQSVQQPFGITVRPFVSSAVWGWGDNTVGQVGTGALLGDHFWLDRAELSGATDVVAGGRTACALMADTTVRCWGDNTDGQLGDGSTVTNNPTPVHVTGLSTVTALAAGPRDVFALKADGTVWGWGRNGSDGAVGSNGRAAPWGVPVQIAGLSDITAIAAGGALGGYAVKSDGTLWGWGAAPTGGAATPKVAGTPFQVPGLSGVTQAASVGLKNGYALESDGSVWAWGNNYYGQLGDGTTVDRAAPAPVLGLPAISTITSNSAQTAFAIATDGSVWAWGNNSDGQLGTGVTSSTKATPTPAPISGLAQVTQVASEGGIVFALTADHQVWAWGVPAAGATLGVSGAINAEHLKPVLADMVPPATRIAAGGNTGYALGLP